MEQFFFYKRDKTVKPVMSRDIRNLEQGDSIEFYGKLYDSNDYKNVVAETVIRYKILFITKSGLLIETNNVYKFNKGDVQFCGEIFSENFDVYENNVVPYDVETSILSFDNATGIFRFVDGFSKYKITGNGVGEIMIYLQNK